MCPRKRPSSLPPIRSIAARDLAFRASVLRVVRRTPQVSKAWPSMSSLASVFTAVRCASGVSQVQPISTASGRSRDRCCGEPGGHDQRSKLQKRVEPMTRPSRTVAKALVVVSRARRTPHRYLVDGRSLSGSCARHAHPSSINPACRTRKVSTHVPADQGGRHIACPIETLTSETLGHIRRQLSGQFDFRWYAGVHLSHDPRAEIL